MSNTQRPSTIGELKESGYQALTIREELQRNLIKNLSSATPLFEGIIGYEDTVIPQLENAILAGQDIILLGERGQAKTRIIRSLILLLDEYTPVIAGVEIPENPYKPVSAQAISLVKDKGDDTPITWLHRDQRYGEKLATPDITIADLIGEIDPIKVAEGRYLSDELTLHFGLIPKTNRGILAINELPDLSERIQVGLLNIMEERDIQIRGHKVRLPLDVLLVATANPEDYTNRGRIITPLKDRFGSQIRTHYPQSLEHEIQIMEQESQFMAVEGLTLHIPQYMKEIIAEISHIARLSPDVSQRSGVSVRASISNYENLVANALRRAIKLKENQVVPRISDLPFIIPALQGKIEFEILDDGHEEEVILKLVEEAVIKVFNKYYSLEDVEPISQVFRDNITVDTGECLHSGFYEDMLKQIDGLGQAISTLSPTDTPQQRAAAVEFVLEGLHVNQKLNKDALNGQYIYRG